MKRAIALLNGPNLNLLGTREPTLYGNATLTDIEQRLQGIAAEAGVELLSFQSNHEGALIDQIQAWSKEGVRFGLINPGGFTHTSVALRDCIAACAVDFIEVHISHIHQRETFRHHSFTAAVCSGQISGLGPSGYEAALRHQIGKLG
jgi:3-dehydroquinate dehydratase-2